MATRKKDQFSQIGYIKIVESAAGTLTFNGLSVFSNVLSQRGMIIQNVEYLISPGLALLDAEGDSIIFGLSGDDSLTGIDISDPEVYDYNKIERIDFGTAGSAQVLRSTFVNDFTGLPGGGMLVPADRLYGYVKGTSLASEVTIYVRFRYTIIDLSAQDYLELAQSMRVLK